MKELVSNKLEREKWGRVPHGQMGIVLTTFGGPYEKSWSWKEQQVIRQMSMRWSRCHLHFTTVVLALVFDSAM